MDLGDDRNELNIWTNAPRVQWHRMTFLVLRMFVVFKLPDTLNSWSIANWFGIVFSFIAASWMAAEQMCLATHYRLNKIGQRNEKFISSRSHRGFHKCKFFSASNSNTPQLNSCYFACQQQYFVSSQCLLFSPTCVTMLFLFMVSFSSSAFL